MTAGAHDAGGGFGRSAGANAVRGGAVIVGAVILGLILMARGIDDSTAAATDPDITTTTVAPAATDQSTPDEATTITTAPPQGESTSSTLGAQRPTSEVLILALNGTVPARGGVAGRLRDTLVSNGYGSVDPKNADTRGPSVILFVEGYESDALAIAALIGVDPVAVVKPFDPATSPIADTQGAHIVVMVGDDEVITS